MQNFILCAFRWALKKMINSAGPPHDIPLDSYKPAVENKNTGRN
jgi:hypothetical protein